MNEAQKKILIVDDEPSVIIVISEFLKWKGYQVLIAVNGLDAIAINDKENPYLIILDLRMPGIDGIETLRRIRKTDKEVKVIILSGYITDDIKMDGDYLGISSYLDKPFDSETLYKAINNIGE